MLDTNKRTILKTLTDKLMEIGLSQAILKIVGFPLELAVGLPIVIEIIQIGVYVLNEKIWSKVEWNTLHEGHLCEPQFCPLKNCPCPLHEKFKENDK